jgi:hypothetical protein
MSKFFPVFFCLGSVRFFRFQTYKTKTEPVGFFKILISLISFFFTVRFFQLLFFGLIGFSVFLLTPSSKPLKFLRYVLDGIRLGLIYHSFNLHFNFLHRNLHLDILDEINCREFSCKEFVEEKKEFELIHGNCTVILLYFLNSISFLFFWKTPRWLLPLLEFLDLSI